MDYTVPLSFSFPSFPINKRRKSNHVSRRPYANDTEDFELAEDIEDDVDREIWLSNALFTLDAPQVAPFRPTNSPNKRTRDFTEWDDAFISLPMHTSEGFDGITQEQEDWLAKALPELFPTVPLIEDRLVNLSISNPFADNVPVRHPGLKATSFQLEDGAVNGYIKFRLRIADVEDQRGANAKKNIFAPRLAPSRDNRSLPIPLTLPGDIVPYLPPDFGRGLKFDQTDAKLLKFYLVGYCQGRTLLSKTNFWMIDVASMAVADECVKHALLALAGAYVLDYLPSMQLLERTNQHYQKAVALITDALANQETHEVSKGDSVVSAILLLVVDDTVNWELRKPKGGVPNWYRGARLAKSILDHSDPGYRYWKATNVQSSTARLANANWTAFACILAQPVTPLKREEDDNSFSWLLEGTEREVRKIHGSTGLCPKLLHTFAQITHLSTRIMECPDSVAFPMGAAKLEKRLKDFRQWSEFSDGYQSSEDLLASCDLDANGKVNCPAKVTELTGETWVAAIQIYLHCRLFRNQEAPISSTSSGTTQPAPSAPFFPIFLAAIVSIREEDYNVVNGWFEQIVSGAGCRSSVPPVWPVVKSLWKWLDVSIVNETYDEEVPIGQRRAWWEEMVEYLIEKEGWLSLT
ncbi:hypothetical protein V492_01382 [Pseudogymnoascus sp. VKM F-4246]|nr:hypothetical protein V492_01382 [Pseudogymnoascus sp. VKM F-4246]